MSSHPAADNPPLDPTLDSPPDDLPNMVEACRHEADPALTVLRKVQEKFGFVPQRYVRHTAMLLKLPFFRVHRAAKSDSQLTLKPPGKVELRVCLGPVCSDNHAAELLGAVCNQLCISAEETTTDGHITLHTIFCSGACHAAPIMMINGHHIGPITVDLVPRVLDKADALT